MLSTPKVHIGQDSLGPFQWSGILKKRVRRGKEDYLTEGNMQHGHYTTAMFDQRRYVGRVPIIHGIMTPCSANNFRGKRCSEHVVSTNTCLLRFTGNFCVDVSCQKYLERLQDYNRSGTFLHLDSTENLSKCHNEKLSRLLVGVFGNFSLCSRMN